MKQYKPDRHCLTTMRLLITAAVVIVLWAVRYFIPIEKIVMLCIIVVIAIACFEMFVHLPMYFNSISYSATETEVTKSSGVFIKVHQSVRYSSIQYTTRITSPLSQHTGFNFIIFFVYGGQLRLLFLKRADADEIISLSGSISVKEDKDVL
ncbi:PH domain-containing protein [Ruminococcus sp.]|uniref:PH domain-containing protein n=1 Tax=Ruminococcus sp. TaxID=41978 RepID=UPI0025FE6148|nr:PH domain-containing protein [Ruminococcus sp.]MBQ6033955.1 PH domain-containing protein [Ruminococcus sp.]MBQ6251331.1 PH domain-containing protein [Ruminococcus sp.]MBR0512187.1 PH domain-containing protein [Ruminococcus sp.]